MGTSAYVLTCVQQPHYAHTSARHVDHGHLSPLRSCQELSRVHQRQWWRDQSEVRSEGLGMGFS